MENIAASIESIFNKADRYGKTSLELFKLKVISKSADAAASLTSRLVVAIFIGLSLVVLNTGAALWIGEAIGKSYYGFFIVAGFYAVIAALLNFFRNAWIKTPINNSIIAQVLKQ